MELFFSKVATQFVMPLGLSLLLVSVAGILFWVWRKGTATVVLAGTVIFLWLASSGIVAEALLASLEREFPPVLPEDSPAADAIVVLGGVIGNSTFRRSAPDLSGAADRVLHAARLYRAGKAPVVVVSGGGLPWTGEAPEANAIGALLIEWGVPAEAIILELESATTHENALKVSEIITERELNSVLLVTSSWHMRRALSAFRAVGVSTQASATDFERVVGTNLTLLDFLPSARALEVTSRAMKEYLGFLYYRARGWAAVS